MTDYFKTASILFLIILFFNSCDLYNNLFEEENEYEISSFTLSTDGSGLEDYNSPIDLYEEGGDTAASLVRSQEKNNNKGEKKNNLDFSLTYEARVPSPSVDGAIVQTSDVLVDEHMIFAAYNTAGPVFKGALQILEVSDDFVLSLTNEILFTDLEIFTLETDDENLYIGGQANPDAYGGNRSFLAELSLDSLENLDADSVVSSITWLESYANTGIASHDNKIYAGTGATGGELVIIDKSNDTMTSASVDDIRDIEPYHGGVILIKGPVDGYDAEADAPTVNGESEIQIWKNHNSVSPDKTYAIDDFVSAEHKASIEVYKNRYAFLGLSEAGFKMLDMKDVGSHEAEIVYELPNPAATGYITDTNSVSTDGKYIFSANGEYGFRVMEIKQMNGKNAGFAELVGFYPFEEDVHVENGQFYSANHIDYKNNLLFVASGIGGVMVFVLND